MSKKIRGITVSIGANTDKLRKELSGVETNLKSINKDLTQVNRALKFDPSNAEILAQKQTLLNKNINETNEKLKILKKTKSDLVNDKSGETTAENIQAINYEIAKAETQLKSFKKELIATSNVNLEKLGAGLQKVGSNITKYVSVPIAGTLTLATKASVDFESAFAGVRKTVDASEKEFQELEQEVRKLALQIPASASEIAKMGEIAGQLGIQKENLMEFSEVMIALGEATNMTSEEGATQLARFANIVGMNQQNFENLGSTITALGNNLATTESEITEMSLRLAGAGKQIGLTEAQIMSFAAALSSVGIEAEAGGSAFSKVMLNIDIAASKGVNELEGFAEVANMTASQFKELWDSDPSTALFKFIEGLGNLESRGQNTAVVLENLQLSEIRVRDALLRASNASDVFKKSLEVGTTAWKENIALQEEAGRRYATTESQMQITKNQAVELAMSFGDIMLPKLRSLLTGLNSFITSLNELNPSTKDYIVNLGLFAVGIGPVISGVGKLINTITKLSTAFGVSSAACGGIIGAITVLIPLVLSLIDSFKETEVDLSETFKSTSEVIGEVDQKFAQLEEDSIKSFKNIQIEFSTTLSELQQSVEESELNSKWDELLQNYEDILETHKNNVIEKYQTQRDAINNILTGDDLKEALTKINELEKIELDNLTEIYSSSLEELYKITGKNGENLSELSSEELAEIEIIFNEFINSLSNKKIDLSEFKSSMSTETQLIIDEIRSKFDGKAFYDEEWEEMINKLKESMEADIKSTIEEIDESIKNVKILENTGFLSEEVAQNTISQLEELKTSIESKMAQDLQFLYDKMPELIKEANKQPAFDEVDNFLELLFGFSDERKEEISNEAKKTIDGFWESFGTESLEKDWESIGENIFEGFKNGNSTSQYEELGRKNAESYLNAFEEEMDIHSPSKKMKKTGNNTFLGYKEGSSNQKFLNLGVDNAKNYLNGIQANLNNSRSQMMPSILSNNGETYATNNKKIDVKIYAQTLDDNQINKLVNILDEKFGSVY